MQKHTYWVFFLLILNTAVYAANWKDNPEFTSGHPCAKDLPKFCTNAPFVPNKQNHYRCLAENFSRLGHSCKQFMLTFWKPFACTSDVMKLCKGDDQNLGRSMPCLEKQMDKLAPNCRTYVKKIESLSQARIEQHAACEESRQKFCSGKHGNDIGTCMKEHEAQLSDNCKAKIKKLQDLI